MIVKNETAIIERCLTAVAPVVDCYVICDTGSSDDTIGIIRRFFEQRGVPGLIPTTTFRNFEQARNEALDAARSSALEFDYILMCDADMELVVERPAFREELIEPAYLLTQRGINNGLEYQNLRLLKRSHPARYRGVTHEYLDIGVAARVSCDAIWYRDHASGANRSNKFERDIALLQEGLAAEPDNERYTFYLANSYFDLGDHDNAMLWYEKRLRMGGWPEERFYSCYRIGQCLQLLGREADMVWRHLDTYAQYPHRAESLHCVALYYQRKSQHNLAGHFAEIGLKIPSPAGGLFVESEVYAWRLTDILAVSMYWTHRRAEGAVLNRRLLTLVPEGQRARIQTNLEFCEGSTSSTQQTTQAVGASTALSPDATHEAPSGGPVEPINIQNFLPRYVGLKQWGWYLSQLDEWMIHVYRADPVHVLEIGAFDGVSANLMLDLVFPHPQSRITAIDPYLPDPTTPQVAAHTRSQFLENVRLGGHENRVTLVETTSFEALSGMEPDHFDFVYIDGSHLARHVLEDAVLAFPLLKTGGIIGFDDYQWGLDSVPLGRPKPAIDAFETVYHDKLELLFSNWQRFFRKRAT